MPTFIADFTADTIGATPAGFTSRWVAGASLLVQSVSGTPNGRAAVTNPTASGRKFWSLDAAGQPSTSQIRALIRTRDFVNSTGTGVSKGLILQGSGAGGSENGLNGGLRKTDTSSLDGTANSILYTAGVVDSVTGSPNALLFNEWLWLITTYDGTNHTTQVRSVGSGFSEGPVLSSVSRPATIGTGRPGIFEGSGAAATSMEVAWLSVGTAGDSAPIYFVPPAVLGVRNSAPLRRHNGSLVASETGISLFVFPRSATAPNFGAPLRATPYTVSTDAAGNLQQSVADIVGLTLNTPVALVYFKAGTDFATGAFGCDFTTVVNL